MVIHQNADNLDNIGTENQSDIFSFQTDDSLGLSMGVSHASGDRAELMMKTEDIKGYSSALNEHKNTAFLEEHLFGEWEVKREIASGRVTMYGDEEQMMLDMGM